LGGFALISLCHSFCYLSLLRNAQELNEEENGQQRRKKESKDEQEGR